MGEVRLLPSLNRIPTGGDLKAVDVGNGEIFLGGRHTAGNGGPLGGRRGTEERKEVGGGSSGRSGRGGGREGEWGWKVGRRGGVEETESMTCGLHICWLVWSSRYRGRQVREN
jgi:hypothetical protein